MLMCGLAGGDVLVLADQKVSRWNQKDGLEKPIYEGEQGQKSQIIFSYQSKAEPTPNSQGRHLMN
jgi:hypothetical protein